MDAFCFVREEKVCEHGRAKWQTGRNADVPIARNPRTPKRVNRETLIGTENVSAPRRPPSINYHISRMLLGPGARSICTRERIDEKWRSIKS